MTEVLHVLTALSDDGRYGGPQSVARTVAGSFGHELWGGDPTPRAQRGPDRPGERRFRGVGAGQGRYSRLAAPGLWWALWRRLGEPGRPVLVHLHAGPELGGLAALVVLRLRRAPFVLQPHGMFSYADDSARARIVRAVFIPLARQAVRVVALTRTEQAQLVRYGIAPDRVTVVPNAVTGGAPASRPAEHTGAVVAFVARLHPRKHPERYTAAAAILAGRRPGTRFLLVGDDQGALPAARAADPGGVVEVVGGVPPETARRILADADVTVVCSDNEPFGLVAVEAMHAGSALVITDSCDLAGDLAQAGAATVTTVAPEDIARGVEHLLADDPARTRQVRAADELVRERYTLEVVRDRWDQLYRSAGVEPDAAPAARHERRRSA